MHDRVANRCIPLIVDMDGTLTPADISLENFLTFIKLDILNLFLLIFWIVKGRAFAKAMVARRIGFNAEHLPLRPEVIALINKAKNEGRPVILASGSHWLNVKKVAAQCGLFDASVGSHAKRNLTGHQKLAWIEAYYGPLFDYIGDSRADFPLWKAARKGYSTGIRVHSDVENITPRISKLKPFLKSMRPHQWAKNALVFVPLATAGLLMDVQAFGKACVAALVFSLVASAIYQLNDLLDIDADRAHPKKRNRPLAAGTISIKKAILIATGLLVVAFAATLLFLPLSFLLTMIAYLLLTTAYSLKLKSVMTLDVITLAGLYTLRIIAGATAIQVVLSFWLLIFSLFFFLSLGYLKRYTELSFATDPKKLVSGRGYVGSDIAVVAMAGMSSGMVSILVMGLYIHDVGAMGIYKTPELLWGLCLCLLYWINRIWIMAYRGEVEGDPVAFAIKDRRSLIIAAIMAILFVTARFLSV